MSKELSLYLQKCEVEFIAKNGGGYPKSFKWDKDIESHLKRIGFAILRKLTVEGDWIDTTSKISVCLDDGFITKI